MGRGGVKVNYRFALGLLLWKDTRPGEIWIIFSSCF